MGYERIPLTQGQETLVSDCDYKELSRYRWQARWSKCTKSYYALRSKKIPKTRRSLTILMHRAILGLSPGDPRIADHVNPLGTLDNRRENLRIASRSENNQNTRLRKDNSTGVRGVYKRPSGRYSASICKNGAQMYLGMFDTPEQAKAVRNAKALELFGAFAQL